MRKLQQLGAIALILGMMAGCNLTSPPPSSLPRVSRDALARIAKKQKPAPASLRTTALPSKVTNMMQQSPVILNALSSADLTGNRLTVRTTLERARGRPGETELFHNIKAVNLIGMEVQAYNNLSIFAE